MWAKIKEPRALSIIAFSFSFAYLLSFLFEGQILYSLLRDYNISPNTYIIISIIGQFIGLFSCGFFAKTNKAAKAILCIGLMISLFAGIPFLIGLTSLWLVALPLASYSSGCALAAWGYFLKAYTPKNQRIKTCADVLIYSNLIMIIINMITIYISTFCGLMIAILCLIIGIIFSLNLPEPPNCDNVEKPKNNKNINIIGALLLLSLFIFILTINSGLMYQVFNPAFEHLTGLTTWYWAIPYITALLVIRRLPQGTNRPKILYFAMAMIIASFISFMMLAKGRLAYLLVDTLMLGACGIFDLFWWSILGEMLDYTENPIRIFGIGLSANVAGVLSGSLIGILVRTIILTNAEVTVIALTVVCITLLILPPLNNRLALILKDHVYLSDLDPMPIERKASTKNRIKTLGALTCREEEVLDLILSGKTNREIAGLLKITENTVKSHVRNIFSKYDVKNRGELISLLLKK